MSIHDHYFQVAVSVDEGRVIGVSVDIEECATFQTPAPVFGHESGEWESAYPWDGDEASPHATENQAAHTRLEALLDGRAQKALVFMERLHEYIEGDQEPSAADQCQVLYEFLGELGLKVS